MVKYCPRCGTPNEDDALYCVKCGNRFLQMSTIETQKPETKKSEKIDSTSPKYNKNNLKTFYTFIYIALIFLGIIVYIVTRDFSILILVISLVILLYFIQVFKQVIQEIKEYQKEFLQILKNSRGEDPIKLLEEKYAKGEISREVFLQKKADLENTENKIKTQS
ncbi:MAG: zinc-ribbon domain-containing protein [Thermoprotei archaeon]|jgi:uncharacterized membrane protein